MTSVDGAAPAGVTAVVTVAAIASAVAGLVHAAAAGSHQGDATLVWMFSATAAAQLGWGWAAAARRPGAALLGVGLALNGGALVTWALSRTSGIAAVESLAAPQAIGLQDAAAALAATVAAVAIVVSLVRPTAAVLPPAWTSLLAAGAFLAVLPALAAGHAHTDDPSHLHAGDLEAAAHGADDHGSADHGSGEVAMDDGHGHDAVTTSTAHHGSDAAFVSADDAHDEHDDIAPTSTTLDHDHTGATSTTSTTTGHDHGTTTTSTTVHEHEEEPITSLDDPRLTPAQVDAAVALIVQTMSGMSGFVTVDDVLAAGYQSIGDGGTPGAYEHFVNWAYLDDGRELDAAHIESVVVKMNADGTRRIVAGMYWLSPGDTMGDVPEIAGSLTTWHDHDSLCMAGGAFVGLAVNGTCHAGTLLDSPPMLHVWIENTPCGPFGVIDELGKDCGAVHEH